MSARPDDSPQIIPYLSYEDATKALDFFVDAFGFDVKSAFRDGVVMIGPGMDGFGTRGVQDPEWASTRVFVYVDDVDMHFERARAAGARIVSEPAAHFSDNRIYVASDCGGQQWIFAEPTDPKGTDGKGQDSS